MAIERGTCNSILFRVIDREREKGKEGGASRFPKKEANQRMVKIEEPLLGNCQTARQYPLPAFVPLAIASAESKGESVN